MFHRTPWASGFGIAIQSTSTKSLETALSDAVQYVEMVRRSIQYVETLQDLIGVAATISAQPRFHNLRKVVPTVELSGATNAQWLFYGRRVGLPEEELLILLGALSSATEQSFETLYGFDGNTVRKLGGRGVHGKAESKYTVVEVWLSGSVEATDEPALQAAISELLAYSDLLLDAAESSVRGSYVSG